MTALQRSVCAGAIRMIGMARIRRVRLWLWLSFLSVLTPHPALLAQTVPPRNVILMIGDGMGFGQIEAAGLYAYGAPGMLVLERAPYRGRVRTHSATEQVTDSAAAATAIGTGQKVANGVVALDIPGSVDSCQQTLAGGLFITGSPIGLPGDKKAFDKFCFETGEELEGIQKVIFHRVAGSHYDQVFHSGYRPEKSILNFLGQGRGDPVDIDLFRVEPLGFQEDLMPPVVWELYHLDFDRGTVARADTRDASTVERGFLKVLPNDGMGLRIGIRDVAWNLLLPDRTG